MLSGDFSVRIRGRLPRGYCSGHALGVGYKAGQEISLVLGVNSDSRDSVHGSRKLLGAEHWVGGKQL